MTYAEIYQYLEQQTRSLFENQFFQGGFFLTMIGSVLYYLKGVPLALWERIKRKILFKATIEETDDLYLYVSRWLEEYYSKSYRNVAATVDDDPRSDIDVLVESPSAEQDSIKKRKNKEN